MRRGVLVWLSLLLLAGCTPAPAWSPGPIVVESATPTGATPTASPSESGTPSATPSSTAPTVPSVSGAINANAYESAHFASPTGRIWCAIYADNALCHFPFGMDMSKVPPSEEVCPGADLDVTGVSVISTADYFCSGGAEALPQTNGMYVGWWKGKGLPSVTYDGQKMAVLPYGRALRKGNYVCASEKVGVTCANTKTGNGFRVALAGVTFIS